MKVKKIPMRMCIACHEMKPKKEMLRIVKPKEGDAFIDHTGKAAGRGAYICDRPECLRKCVKNRLFDRVFKEKLSDETYAGLGDANERGA